MKSAMVALVACGVAVCAQTRPADANAKFFDRRVAPILRKRCLGCHNDDLKDGGISFLDRHSLLKSGPHGVPVVPGDPGRSLLVRALRHDGEIQMPPGAKLPPAEVAVLTEWVRRGAVWGRTLRRDRK